MTLCTLRNVNITLQVLSYAVRHIHNESLSYAVRNIHNESYYKLIETANTTMGSTFTNIVVCEVIGHTTNSDSTTYTHKIRSTVQLANMASNN